jgi:hypothetical protein
MMSPGCASVSSGAGVRPPPGEIALTRTPDGPNSATQARVRVSTAPLLEQWRAPTGTQAGDPRSGVDDRTAYPDAPGGRLVAAERTPTVLSCATRLLAPG